MNLTTILSDVREIESIWFNQKAYIAIDEDDVTKIEAYGEPGEMSMVPWFRILKGDFLYARVNSKMIDTVVYKEKP